MRRACIRQPPYILHVLLKDAILRPVLMPIYKPNFIDLQRQWCIQTAACWQHIHLVRASTSTPRPSGSYIQVLYYMRQSECPRLLWPNDSWARHHLSNDSTASIKMQPPCRDAHKEGLVPAALYRRLAYHWNAASKCFGYFSMRLESEKMERSQQEHRDENWKQLSSS